MLRRPPGSTLIPYTTLFPSGNFVERGDDLAHARERECVPALGPVEDDPAERVAEGELQEFVSHDCSRAPDRKSTGLNSSHVEISYAVFCLKKKKIETIPDLT